jgi:hypothetical protein
VLTGMAKEAAMRPALRTVTSKTYAASVEGDKVLPGMVASKVLGSDSNVPALSEHD